MNAKNQFRLLGGTNHGRYHPYRGSTISVEKLKAAPARIASQNEPPFASIIDREEYEYRQYFTLEDERYSFYVLKGLPDSEATKLAGFA